MGLDCFFTTITISSDNDVPDFEADGQLTQTFHIRLKHSNDLRSVELYETKSAEKVRLQFEEYRRILSIQIDVEIRDFNTDVPIRTLAYLGLSTDEFSNEPV